MSAANPSERELDLLKILWDLGEVKVRAVHEALSAREPIAFTTMQTLLRIMADKGLVKSRNTGRTLYYSAVHTREQVSSRFLDRVFSTSSCSICCRPKTFRRTKCGRSKR